MVYIERNIFNTDIILNSANHKNINTFSGDGLSYDGYHSKTSYIDDSGYLITNEWNEDRPEILKIHDYKRYENEIKINFSYKINSHGFRSQHFTNLSKNKTNILFSGCSFTFGMGLPEEYTWVSLLTNKLKDDAEYFNLGYRAFSIPIIIKNTMSFIRQYGKPEYLFIVFPDSARDFIFNKYSRSYSNVDPRYFNYVSDFFADYTKSYNYETNILRFSEMIKMLEDFCNSTSIKFLWTTWYYPDYKIYKELDFENICPTDTTFLQADSNFYRIFNDAQYATDRYPYENKNSLPYWSIARDLVHPGTNWTHHISEEFFNEIKKRSL